MTRRFVIPAVILAGLLAGPVAVEVTRAAAEELRTGTALVDAGAPVATPEPAAPTAAPVIADPVDHPAQAFDELKAAQKIGWPVAVLVGLTMLLLAAGHLGVSWLKTGSRAFILAALSTGCLAASNAAMSGGAWTAVVLTGVLAAAAMWQADRDKAKAEKARR